MTSTTAAGRASAVGVAAILGACIAGGTASAYWQTSGTGTGKAPTGSMTFTVDALAVGDTPSTTLFPGVAGDLVLRFTNSYPTSVKVVGITAGTLPPATMNCLVSLRLPTSFSDTHYTLTPGAGTLTIPNGAFMDAASPSDCQGDAFTLPVTVKVRS